MATLSLDTFTPSRLATAALGLTSVLAPTAFGSLLEAPDADAAAALSPVIFQVSANCSVCHSNSTGATAMREPLGDPVSPYDLWQSSMMANSSRDPYWRAAVSAEMAATPSRRSEIANTCTRCHTPMAAPDAHGDTEYEVSMDILDEPSLRGALARDGVSCTVCHQIAPDGLGTDESYTGGYEINDDNTIFGPHANLQGAIMTGFTGYAVDTGSHMNDSALCATCHTLFTESTQTNGQHTGGVFFEQTPYLEWRNSDFQNETAPAGPMAASCQECHMPRTDAAGTPISTRVARSPGGGDYSFLNNRSPYGKHVFVGGNTLMPQILRDNSAALGTNAPAAAFDATIAAARAQLQNDTATLSVASAVRTGSTLDLVLQIDNQCGHKFPTGYPARRAWLEVVVTDQSGQVLFASGTHDAEGRLLDGATGQVLPSELAGGPTIPHRDVITSDSEVQAYGLIFDGPNGQPAWRLLQASSNRRDNRLLPQGWSPTHPEAARTMPAGLAADPNFVAGSDQVTYQIDLTGIPGAVDVTATLKYQSIMPRHIAELAVYNTPEITAFMGYLQTANRTPEVIDSVTGQY